MIFKSLVPDYMFEHYDDITPEFLASIGVRGMMIDIDNTLAPYEQLTSDERHAAWFASLDAAGIRCALISNNHRSRVDTFNETLGRLAYWHSAKPIPLTFRRAMKTLGLKREETAVLGDQLWTDAVAAKCLGLPTLIVPPIRDKKKWTVRLKRYLERPYMRRYRETHPEKQEETTHE